MKSYKLVVNLWTNIFFVISQLENADERRVLSLRLQLFIVCVLIIFSLHYSCLLFQN